MFASARTNYHDEQPCQSPEQYIGFNSDSEEAGFNKTAPLLGKLYSSSGYSIDQQYQYLTFYYRVLVLHSARIPKDTLAP
jgi:hypothetical protein